MASKIAINPPEGFREQCAKHSRPMSIMLRILAESWVSSMEVRKAVADWQLKAAEPVSVVPPGRPKYPNETDEAYRARMARGGY